MKKSLFFALFCFANAASLEDAIKDIDISGRASYSFVANKDEVFLQNKAEKNDKSIQNENYHRFRLNIDFKTKLDDDFFALIGMRYDSSDVSGSNSKGDRNFAGIANTHGGLDNIGDLYGNGWGGSGQSLSAQKFYVGYTGFDSTIITFGRQEIDSTFINSIIGTGISIENASFNDILLWAYAFDNIEDSEEEINLKYAMSNDGKPVILTGIDGIATSTIPGLEITPYQNNLFGAGFDATFSYFRVAGEIAHLANVGTFLVGILGNRYNINDNVSIEAKINLSKAILTNNFKAKFTPILTLENKKIDTLLTDNTFFSAYLGLDYYNFSLSLVYSLFGKKDKIGFYGLSNDDYLIKSRYSNYIGAHETFTLKATYNLLDNLQIGLKLLNGKAKNDNAENIKSKEIAASIFYKYSDKMSYYLLYRHITDKYIHKNTIYESNKEKHKFNNFYFLADYNFWIL